MFLRCFSRASLISHIALRLQSGNVLRFRIWFGPQYPHPTTPTEIGSFIFLCVSSLLLNELVSRHVWSAPPWTKRQISLESAAFARPFFG